MAFPGANPRGWCYSRIPRLPEGSVPVRWPFDTLASLTDCMRLVPTMAAIWWKALHLVFKEGYWGGGEEPHPFQTIIRAYLKKSRREIKKDYARGLQTWVVSGSGKRMSPESPCFVSITNFCILWHYESNPYEVETEVWIATVSELVLAVNILTCEGAGGRRVPPKLQVCNFYSNDKEVKLSP